MYVPFWELTQETGHYCGKQESSCHCGKEWKDPEAIHWLGKKTTKELKRRRIARSDVSFSNSIAGGVSNFIFRESLPNSRNWEIFTEYQLRLLLHHKENLFLTGPKVMLNPHPVPHEPTLEVVSYCTVSPQSRWIQILLPLQLFHWIRNHWIEWPWLGD